MAERVVCWGCGRASEPWELAPSGRCTACILNGLNLTASLTDKERDFVRKCLWDAVAEAKRRYAGSAPGTDRGKDGKESAS